jgi:ketosteroid isomerase-like protein
MSEQALETVHRVYEAFNERDIGRLLECLDPDFEIDRTDDLAYAAALLRVLGPRFVILSGGYRGHDEVRRLFETVWEISEWFRVTPAQYLEIDGLVLVPLVLSARAKESGEQGEAQTTHLWTVRDAKATRLRVFADEATAREVAQRELAARDGRERR